MSALNQVQSLVQAALAANAFFTDVPMILEFDPAAGADMIAQMEARFEGALLATGVVIIILSPFAEEMAQSKDSGLSLAVTVPVVFVENPAVNRGAAGPGVTPFGHPASEMMEQGLKSLINGFKFPHMPVLRPEKNADGLVYYHLMPMRRHQITALAA